MIYDPKNVYQDSKLCSSDNSNETNQNGEHKRIPGRRKSDTKHKKHHHRLGIEGEHDQPTQNRGDLGLSKRGFMIDLFFLVGGGGGRREMAGGYDRTLMEDLTELALRF